MKLTNQQLDAMKHFKGPALVLAVPGAGKTTVLLQRICYLKEKHHIKPENILSITFSKTQALDMKKRFPEGQFSTIHAFCYRIIRYANKKRKRQLRLIEGSDFNKYHALRNIYRSLYHKKPRKEELETFFLHYGYLKNTMQEKEHYVTKIDDFISLFNAYEKYKESHHFIDFDDMLHYAYELLDDPKILAMVKKAYPFIQIDEGQDTSKIQMKIVEKICYPENNLFIVADDDQSIYSFRGAEPSYLMDFSKRFDRAKIFFIEENHRSQKEIVRISDAVIKKNQNRYQKTITTKKDATYPIRLKTVKSIQEQYRYIEKNILPHTCILYRNNLSALGLLEYFRRLKQPVKLQNFNLSYLYSFILSDILDFIAFSENPNSMNLFEKLYYKLNAYIKKEQLENLRNYSYDMPIFDRLLDDSTLNDFYVDTFMQLKSAFSQLKKSTGREKIERIYSDLGYSDYIRSKFAKELSRISSDFYFEIYAYLFENCAYYEDFIHRLEEIKTYLNQKSTNDITLSTIHGAKGLEFDHVHIIDLMEGEFPNIHESDQQQSMIEEERRLFYVAMTRAKTSLSLIAPVKRFKKTTSRSRFFLEVESILEEI